MNESSVRGIIVGLVLVALVALVQFIRKDPERARRAKLVGKIAGLGVLALFVVVDPRDGPIVVGLLAVAYAVWWVISGGKKKGQ